MDEIYNKKYFFIIGLFVIFGIFLFVTLINVGANDVVTFSLASNQTNQTCFDSDGGINYLVKGQVNATNSTGIPYSVTDECTSISNLREYYCSSSDAIYTFYSCPNGCVNGACSAFGTTTTSTSSTSTIIPQTTTTTSTSTTSTTALGYGSIYVASNPKKARIYLDDIYKGLTNKTILNVTNTQHNLKLTRPGYLDYVTIVTVYSGQTSEVYAQLQKMNTTKRL